MNDSITNFADIEALWPSRSEFANDAFVTPAQVAIWKHRNSIPSRYWKAIVEGASARGLTQVTYELMARLASQSAEAA